MKIGLHFCWNCDQFIQTSCVLFSDSQCTYTVKYNKQERKKQRKSKKQWASVHGKVS